MSSEKDLPRDSAQPSVLIVDDRAMNRYTIGHILKREGFIVLEASTGKEALEMAKQLPTVIILDVKLPDILGYEVSRRIKANSLTSHIPILQLSSAFLNDESKIYALESGADAYLIQPAEPIILIATVKSLVRLHLAESQARVTAKQWQATFDSLNEGVAILDSSGVIQRCNRAMSELLDWPFGNIERQPFADLVQNRFSVQFKPGGTMPPRELRAGTRFFRLRIDPILLQRKTSGSIAILEETTDQKRAEEALLASERLAATGRIAHTIAHEINNPLEAITNLIYLLHSSLEQPGLAREYLESTEKELQRVSRIAKQILAFNRESSSPIPLRISDLIEDVLALNNRSIVEKDLAISKEWDSELFVRGFPAQLRQVFSNLVRNAIEASPPAEKIRIKISKCTQGKAFGNWVRISIADYGAGISAKNIPKIFEAFFTTKDLKGSGVGLWLSSTIVQEHNGLLRVRSTTRQPHSGTCMSVVLPGASLVSK